MGILRAPLLLNEPSAQVIKGSLKIKSGSYLSRTFGTGSDADVWTFSCWIKRATLGTTQYIFRTPSVDEGFYFSTSNKIDIYRYSGSFTYFGSSPSVLRDCAGWQHIVYAHDSNAASGDRLRLYINGVLQKLTSLTDIGSGSNYSLNSAVAHRIGEIDGYMSQCYFVDGLSLGPGYFGFSDPLTGTWRPQKFKAEGTTVNDGRVFSSTGTFSNWDDDGTYPKTELFDGTLYTGGTPNGASSDSSSEATFDFGNQRIKGFQNLKINIFLSSNQVGAKDVVSVNGIDITNECHKAGNNVWVTVDLGSKFKSLQSFRIANNNIYVGGFIIDGVVVKDSTTENLSFGTNGFYLPMENQDDFEKDKSGNANDFTKNSFSGTSIDPDIVKDSPSGAVTGGRAQTGITTTGSAPANYATLNPLNVVHGTLSEGNLEAQSDTSGQYSLIPSTLLINKTGKFYWEAKFNIGSSDAKYATIGICSESRRMITNQGLTAANNVGDYAIKGWDGGFYTMTNQSVTYNNGSNHSNTLNNNDVVSLAFNADNGKLWFGVNGTYLTNAAGVGNPSLDLNPDLTAPTDIGHYPAFGAYNSGGNSSELHVNFGQKPFKYAPPQGFLPLNSATVRPNTVISRPDQYVGVTTYAGNTSSVVVKDLSFKPDLVWVKGFTDADRHGLYDTVRGVTKRLQSPYTNTEDTQNGVTSFNDNGFSIGNYGDSNGNARGYVAWAWKAGGDKNTFNVDDVGYATAAAAGLDGGSITPSGASVGTKQGFSILKWTGTSANGTLSHGLTKSPEFVIVKKLTGTGNWYCYHSGLTDATKYIWLNSTNAEGTQTAAWNSTAPTSSVLHLGAEGEMNANSNSSIAYLWHSVPGLQKFGTYGGLGGTANGSFVELGFRPAIVWVKDIGNGNSNSHWCIFDSRRPGFNTNPAQNRLHADADSQQDPDRVDEGNGIVIESNGFRVRSNNWYETNLSGATYIYCAWAEAPASNLFGGQSNAR